MLLRPIPGTEKRQLPAWLNRVFLTWFVRHFTFSGRNIAEYDKYHVVINPDRPPGLRHSSFREDVRPGEMRLDPRRRKRFWDEVKAWQNLLLKKSDSRRT